MAGALASYGVPIAWRGDGRMTRGHGRWHGSRRWFVRIATTWRTGRRTVGEMTEVNVAAADEVVRMPSARHSPRSVVLVGGGRWGHVLFRELAGYQPEIATIHWVSHRRMAGLAPDPRLEEHGRAPRLRRWGSLAECLEAIRPEAAIVANLPTDHFPTARALLERGIPTLIEKPVVPTAEQLAELIALADQADVAVAAGLEFLVAEPVAELRRSLDRLDSGPMASVEVRWEDPDHSARGLHSTRFDLTLDVVHDLMPHVLSMLQVLFDAQPIRGESVAIGQGGWAAAVTFEYGTVPVEITLSRAAVEQDRRIVVRTGDRTVALDFGPTPRLKHHDETGTAETLCAESRTPINSELVTFFGMLGPHSRRRDAPLGLEATRGLHQDVMRLAEASARARRSAAATEIVQGRCSELALRALAPDLLPGLVDEGLVTHSRDDVAALGWLRDAAVVIGMLADDPFARQSDLAGLIGADLDQYRALCRVLRGSAAAQEIILTAGKGMKYWTKTIGPLAATGAVQRALDKDPSYPLRVGIYPGPSCMFFCTFCGRNYDARYDRRDVGAGSALLRRILETAPNDDPDRFFISGGLEPLTNPNIGSIVATGVDRGFRLSLYTNGQMLTPTLLKRQDALWRLTTLRVSLYGGDEEAQFEVTRRPNAFQQVTSNLRDFLRLRDQRETNVRFGLNYVVLPGRVAQVAKVLDLVAELNEGVDSPIDFLTLREDFSVGPTAGLTYAEREELTEVFASADARCDGDLRGLTIDYGYGLEAIRRGEVGQPLRYVSEDEIRRIGYPQISVVVDLLGDVYLYREAGFLDRPGADRYIIGRIDESTPLEDVVRRFVESGRDIAPLPGDTGLFDIFDHVVTSLLNQAESDATFGVPFGIGPVAARDGTMSQEQILALSTLPVQCGHR